MEAYFNPIHYDLTEFNDISRHFISAFARNLSGEVFPAAAGAFWEATKTFLGFVDMYKAW